MQTDDLLVAIKTTLQKTKVNELTKMATENNISINELINLTFHHEEKVAFRVAWVLENIYMSYPDRFLAAAVYFLDRFAAQDNLSCRRHFGKILALMTSKKASSTLKEIIENYQTDQIVETVFSWLIDEKVPVAVKSHCLNILANFNIKHPWIKEELLATMDFLIDKESIAFYAKVKQVRRQLK